MAIDVSDETFEAEVMQRSDQVPVVVDLWAEWCGPCRTLGPILDKVIGDTDGQVVLAKVDTDMNPQTAAMFQVQSIPAVHAVVGRKVVDGFIGARGEHEVREFVQRLIPSPEQQRVAELLAIGGEQELREAVELTPAGEEPVLALAALLVDNGDIDEALGLLERIPATVQSRQIAARARLAESGLAAGDDEAIERRLGELLESVKSDQAAHTEFLDLLELLGSTDQRAVDWRRKLTARLF